MNAPLIPSPRRPIRELPDELISQIAAGEVIDRPAAAVRELVDNALDAGATQITVRLAAGGVRSISVEDDGAGIAREDLPLALKRHATSKIASLSDLESVATMGFRGEALAAMASVADLSITTRPVGAPHAWRLHARSGELSSAARPTGATVELQKLFFSTPARRKYLKTDATELSHALEAVRRHALARPKVGSAVWREGRLVAQWRAAPAARRLADVLGADFSTASCELLAERGPLRLQGRVGQPEAAGAGRSAVCDCEWPLRAQPPHQPCRAIGLRGSVARQSPTGLRAVHDDPPGLGGRDCAPGQGRGALSSRVGLAPGGAACGGRRVGTDTRCRHCRCGAGSTGGGHPCQPRLAARPGLDRTHAGRA